MENTGRRSLSLLRALVVVLAAQLATAQDPASALVPSEVKRADWSSMRGAWGKRGDLTEVELEDADEKRAGWDKFQGSWGKRGDELAEADLQDAEAKRADWNKFQGSWGKRGGEGLDLELQGAGNKRADWNKFQGSWGKREDDLSETELAEEKRADWNRFQGSWGKRGGWSQLQGSWGKRDVPAALLEELEKRPDWSSLQVSRRPGPWLTRGRNTPLFTSRPARLMAGAPQKRGWLLWGKRPDTPRVVPASSSSSSSSGTWGKRSADWNSLRGTWGKRATDWGQFKGSWGKRARMRARQYQPIRPNEKILGLLCILQQQLITVTNSTATTPSCIHICMIRFPLIYLSSHLPTKHILCTPTSAEGTENTPSTTSFKEMFFRKQNTSTKAAMNSEETQNALSMPSLEDLVFQQRRSGGYEFYALPGGDRGPGAELLGDGMFFPARPSTCTWASWPTIWTSQPISYYRLHNCGMSEFWVTFCAVKILEFTTVLSALVRSPNAHITGTKCESLERVAQLLPNANYVNDVP
ncbi:uncharacterized protein LOC134776486 [Penaeus indicus]|uniref:uncharacterized protein LOC134776486 n=1 Tax=Penaeus indicus TaxID=29960 RepID=UPI00300CA2D4